MLETLAIFAFLIITGPFIFILFVMAILNLAIFMSSFIEEVVKFLNKLLEDK